MLQCVCVPTPSITHSPARSPIPPAPPHRLPPRAVPAPTFATVATRDHTPPKTPPPTPCRPAVSVPACVVVGWGGVAHQLGGCCWRATLRRD